MAVDANHVYWAQLSRIGRANLDGTGIEPNFIWIGGPVNGTAVAADAAHVYWRWVIGGPPGGHGIGRANLDGTGVEHDFFELSEVAPAGPAGLAVDALTDTELAGKARAAKTQKQNGNATVVKVKVRADERLTAEASGKIGVNPSYKLKPKQADLTTGEASTLRLKPKKKGEARQIATALEQGESATAKLKVKLSDLAANSEVEKLSVKLKRG